MPSGSWLCGFQSGSSYPSIRSKTVTSILPIRLRKQDTDVFPLLRLPRELRDEVYTYIFLSEDWTPPYHVLTGIVKHNRIQHDQEDPIPFQPPGNSGLLSYYGKPPPLKMLLVSKQIRDEVLYLFYSRTAFEVGPLTPHDDIWRIDPSYGRLQHSSQLANIRKLRVRVDVARMQMGSYLGGVVFKEIGIEDCISRVQPLAELLVRVLRKGANSLSVIIIDWKDDFPDDMNWQLKASILFPFGSLEGVQIFLGKLTIADSGREAAKKMLDETLEGLSALVLSRKLEKL